MHNAMEFIGTMVFRQGLTWLPCGNPGAFCGIVKAHPLGIHQVIMKELLYV